METMLFAGPLHGTLADINPLAGLTHVAVELEPVANPGDPGIHQVATLYVPHLVHCGTDPLLLRPLYVWTATPDPLPPPPPRMVRHAWSTMPLIDQARVIADTIDI